MSEQKSITKILEDWGNGNSQALDELMPLVYEELHKQASRYLRKERVNHTLQPTALIHETYLKLVEQNKAAFNDRTHFFAVASGLMRRILVDHARSKKRDKRGGNDVILPLEEAVIVVENNQNIDLLALNEVLERLEDIDTRQARIVELRFFSGLSLEETADAMNLSRTTVAQEWAMAKAWLYREMTR